MSRLYTQIYEFLVNLIAISEPGRMYIICVLVHIQITIKTTNEKEDSKKLNTSLQQSISIKFIQCKILFYEYL